MVKAENATEQLVIDFFESLNTGDLERIRPHFHEDSTWTPMAKNIPGAGVHRGRKGIVDEFLGPVRGLFVPGDPKNTIKSIIGKGNFAAVETVGVGTFLNGKKYENHYAWFVEFKDGQILAIREYMDSLYVKSLVD
jgi:ketosteroid isomerase-like protein